MNQLEQLKQYTTVVADTGDFSTMKQFQPQDATTNPSLILKAVGKEDYKSLVARVVGDHRNEEPADIIDPLLIAFGAEILKIVPGRVSTEVDARLSFDTPRTVAKAHQLIALYEAQGIDKSRVLIKIASTWEGIRAAEMLEREGIHCNMTLMFGTPQAIEAAQAKVTLVSPFVGRITDWFKAAEKKEPGFAYAPDDDPGIRFVRDVYATYKKLGYATQVMGASFRTPDQVLALAGCDLLTISPDLLQKLTDGDAPVTRHLDAAEARGRDIQPSIYDEPKFRFDMNQDQMATEKLSDGIRVFAADAVKLEKLIAGMR